MSIVCPRLTVTYNILLLFFILRYTYNGDEIMKNIDDYIQQTINMKNTSDGGSPAYHFDDVVLIKYQGSIKYGPTREGAELIAQKANEKNAKGVRTPAHLDIKRVIDGDNEICWVLQERALGKCFINYCNNRDSNIQLAMQSILANVPESHYEKLINDVSELFNLGLEPKPKNMFYDENIQTGGFTIIDLAGVYGETFNPNSLKDILGLYKMIQGIYNCSCISSYDKTATESNKIASRQQSLKINQKVFSAMEKTIPNFEQHRRWVLRSIPDEVLIYFSNNGTYVGDLSLNEQEYKQFNQTIKNIIENSIKKIEEGTNVFWQIRANEIRTDLDNWGMQDAWRYHKSNNRDKNEFSGTLADYNYRNECIKDLNISLNQIFEEQLDLLSVNTSNPLILQAKGELDKTRVAELEKSRRL